jgi:PAS domain S-box-containing protein
VVALRDKPKKNSGDDVAWAQDYAVFLFDPDGHVGAWYSGAERIYGYLAEEMFGRSVDCLYPTDDIHGGKLQEELKRVAAHGHSGNEGWHVKKDGSRFWANVLTMALRGEQGELQGFARVVRDFSNRHSRAEKMRRSGVLLSERRSAKRTIDSEPPASSGWQRRPVEA